MKQIMNVFIRAIVRIFSFGERLIVPFNLAIASLNGTINVSSHKNILTIALINVHYLYNIIYKTKKSALLAVSIKIKYCILILPVYLYHF